MTTLTQILAVAGLLAAPAITQAATLDFSGSICNGGGACSNGVQIDQSYGDTASLDVIWDSNTSLAGLQNLFHWNGQYSDLTNVAYGGAEATVEIFLKPLAGFSVTLSSFMLGAWPNLDRPTQVTILDGLGNLLQSSGPLTISGLTASLFNTPFTSANGIRIQFGPDAFNVGIDNISYDVAPINVSAIPLPASAPLILAGLGALATLRRRGARGRRGRRAGEYGRGQTEM